MSNEKIAMPDASMVENDEFENNVQARHEYSHVTKSASVDA